MIKKISIIKDKKKLAAIKEYVEAEFETFDQNGAIKLTAEMKKTIAIEVIIMLNSWINEHILEHDKELFMKKKIESKNSLFFSTH